MVSELTTASRSVAVDVLVHGPQSRAQLAKKLGLSPATLTRLVRPLLDAGVLVESGAVKTPGRGRSSVPLDVVANDYRFIGVKLTTESIYAVVTDLRAGVLHSLVLDEPSLAVPDVVSAVADVVDRLTHHVDRRVTAVGVTVGGLVQDGETVTDSPFLHWHDVPFRTLLSDRVTAPLYLANDVVGLTKVQQWFGYGRDGADFALLTIGAGVGYGLVIDRHVVPTKVSPIGHLAIDPHGPLCSLGHRGCVSSYLTTQAMTAAVGQAVGRAVTYGDVLDLAKQGDGVATRVVQEAAHALGRAVAAVTSLTGVERIILSGEGIMIAEIASEALRAGSVEYSAGHQAEVGPVIRPMGFLEWARGAAAVAISATFP